MNQEPVDKVGRFVERVALLLAAVIVLGFFIRGDVLLEAAIVFALGAFTSVARFVEERPFSRDGVALVALGIAIFGIGFHQFAVWLHREMTTGDTISSRWMPRTSVIFVSLILCFFLAGICAIGVAHQTGWLATDPAGVWELRDNRLMFQRSRDVTAENVGNAENR